MQRIFGRLRPSQRGRRVLSSALPCGCEYYVGEDFSMKTSGLIATVMLWSLLGVGQDVHVSQGKGIVVLSVRAVKPYLLMSGEEKTATFAVVCTQKGKKTSHVLKFLPGEQLVEDTPGITATSGEFVFNMTIGGTKQMTEWALSDPVTF